MNINKFLKDRLDKVIEKIDSVEKNLNIKKTKETEDKKKEEKK
jgi:hypothetical protein